MAIEEKFPELIPFDDVKFRDQSSLSERLQFQRMLEKYVIDWQNTTANLKTSGRGEFGNGIEVTGDISGTIGTFSGLVTLNDLFFGELAEVNGGVFTVELAENIDLWDLIIDGVGCTGGAFLGSHLSFIDGGTFT